MNRRGFFKWSAGIGAVGLTVYFAVSPLIPVFPKRPMPDARSAAGWIRYDGGQYELRLPRIEIGQNIATGLKQIACDELGIGWDELDCQMQSTATVERVRSTVGSESIKNFALPLAQACAALRDAVEEGNTDGLLDVVERPTTELRAFSGKGQYVGASPVPEQVENIVRGEPVYAADVRREGMLYGRVLRAQYSPEAETKPVSWKEAAAKAVSGFVALVRDPALEQGQSMGLGIVARTPGALERISEALEVVWEGAATFDQTDIDAMVDVDGCLRDGDLTCEIEAGEIDREAGFDVDIRVDVPMAAHGSIEPRVAVAEFGPDGRLQVWAGSQDIFYTRDVLARNFGLEDDQVHVHARRVGGGFGGRTICTVELEAAVLAKHVQRPVKIQWTRRQEFTHGFHRPPSSHRIRARITHGRIAAWWHGFASSHIIFTNAAMPSWMQMGTDFIGDMGVARGALLPYRIEKRRIEYELERLPVLTGPWRGLGAGPNLLAIESAIDECAVAAKTDPVTFRLAHIDDDRLSRVLQRVATVANWTGPEPDHTNGRRTGRGVACGIYKDMSYAAVIAEVEVDNAGEVTINRLWCVHDCGRVINPDQVRAQCEGNLVWGIGMVFTDQLSAAEGVIAAENFGDAPIPEMTRIPPIHVDLIDEGEAPTGAGETAIVAASAAISNAIRQATGVRVTQFPVDPAHLRRTSS